MTNFEIITFDEQTNELDRRIFEGNHTEAVEELKAEYDEFFPARNAHIIGEMKDHDNYRDDKFWSERARELKSARRTKVTGRNPNGRFTRTFEIIRAI